ncbi:MAG: hypothetical protein JW700_03735 [Candidatus Aenigmarchaeota archaeon]|nr:hypothetical protein [Candidatus Aenigmarchaeota archaeon]
MSQKFSQTLSSEPFQIAYIKLDKNKVAYTVPRKKLDIADAHFYMRNIEKGLLTKRSQKKNGKIEINARYIESGAKKSGPLLKGLIKGERFITYTENKGWPGNKKLNFVVESNGKKALKAVMEAYENFYDTLLI